MAARGHPRGALAWTRSAEIPSGLARAFGIAAVVVLIGLGAHVRFFLPDSPVPVTLQTFFVLLAGAMLGPRDGMIAALCYIAAGTAGGPVFALGPGGVAYLCGPTGGYLVGFVAAAGVVGVVAGRNGAGKDAGPARLAAGLLAGGALILLPGALHLALVTGLGFRRAMEIGVGPFIAGDLLKVAAAWATVAAARSFRRRRRTPQDLSYP